MGTYTTTKSGRIVHRTHHYIPGTAETAAMAAELNYYASLANLDEDDVQVQMEVAGVGAGLGGGFNHTTELHVMKYREAMNRPDAKSLERGDQEQE